MTGRIDFLCVGLDDSLTSVVDRLAQPDWTVDRADGAVECVRRLDMQDYDVLLAGQHLPGIPLEQLLEEAIGRRARLSVIVLTRRPDYATAVRLAQCGAAGYIPVTAEDFVDAGGVADRIRAVCSGRLRESVDGKASEGLDRELIGKSRAIRGVIQLVRMIGPRQSTILISGRTGTGKELVARAIHRASPRAAASMVVVNCGAIPENLIEAEFFGHVKGAFTGAVNHRVGRFEQARGGTIFLDEVGEMPVEMQSKLLRTLQEREFQRVGSSETVKVDVRVIAATNRDLKVLVEQGHFREDLYYRLNVVPIAIPSLAERVEDVPLLVEHLLARVCRREDLALKKAGPEAIRRLMDYSWPGNVRQLENAVEKAVALSGDRVLLYPSDFSLPSSPLLTSSPLVPDVRLPASGLDFGSVVTQFEHSLMDQALRFSKGNKKRAAELLRIKRTTFAAKWRTLQAADLNG